MDLATTLLDARTMLALEPEDLAGIIVEVVQQGLASKAFHVGNGGQFNVPVLINPIRDRRADPNWPDLLWADLEQALTEAIAWLESQVLIVRYKDTSLYVLTRRGRALRTRVDVQAYREAGILPVALVHPHMAAKVVPLFVRGDHDIAVWQALKEVECAVREAAGYGPEKYGVDMMRTAFHPKDGPLTDPELLAAEREAEAALFAGAIGHAKNPGSHRHVQVTRPQAARLILFASHLLEIAIFRGLARRTFSS